MKFPRLILGILLVLSLVSLPVFTTSCSTAPDQRTAAAQTLGVVGSSAKAAMDSATQLLKQGTITVAQWQKVATFYDTKFQPAYNLALAAVKSDLSSLSSPDITNLSLQFLALVAELTAPTHTSLAHPAPRILNA